MQCYGHQPESDVLHNANTIAMWGFQGGGARYSPACFQWMLHRPWCIQRFHEDGVLCGWRIRDDCAGMNLTCYPQPCHYLVTVWLTVLYYCCHRRCYLMYHVTALCTCTVPAVCCRHPNRRCLEEGTMIFLSEYPMQVSLFQSLKQSMRMSRFRFLRTRLVMIPLADSPCS